MQINPFRHLHVSDNTPDFSLGRELYFYQDRVANRHVRIRPGLARRVRREEAEGLLLSSQRPRR